LQAENYIIVRIEQLCEKSILADIGLLRNPVFHRHLSGRRGEQKMAEDDRDDIISGVNR